MPRFRLLLVLLASLASFALAGVGTASASGTITFDGSPGTGAPPSTLGPWEMSQFGSDPQPLFSSVGGVTGPTGDVTFSPALEHRSIGDGWATWSNGYTGDVYWTGEGLSATITLPSDTSAFYFYAEPDPFAVFSMTAVAQDGTSTSSGPILVDGFAGARYFGFCSQGSDSIASITISSAADFAVGEFGISTGTSSSTSTSCGKKYVALGDSYSSGEGNPPFLPGTDGPSDYCHRSSQAYPEVLGAQFGMPLFYACSGAVTSDITSTFHDTEPPQITQPGVDTTADLLTMTIGGNDAGFSDVLKACIEQKLKADFINAAIGPVGRWLGLGQDPSCAHSDTFTSSVNTNIDNVFWPVKTTELSLLSAVDPVNTSVIVADYPLLFPSSSDDQNCLQLSALLTNDDMNFMNGAGNRLDGVLQEAAAEAGVNFVDVRGTFAGHEICGPAGSYLNGISFASGSGGACTWSVLGHCIIPGLPIVGSFHPNAAGHTEGYAAAIASYINSAADQTPAGFPVNPPALPDPPSTPAVPADGIGELTVQPVTPGSADCAGTVQAGQEVQLSGGGFVPGTAVQLIVSSAGFGSTGELQVGTATADGTGHIAATVRIPLGATGFTPSGASAGLVFVDAIGAGSAADHQDDVGMAGLAPHTSTCGTLEPFTFNGFTPPVANPPQVNAAQPGRAVPVKFSVPGSNGTLSDVLAAGYPQSAPVSCTAPDLPTSGDPTVSVGDTSTTPSDQYNYVWKTDRSWRGCRALIVKLVDGTYHEAVFDFGT
jgi:GDSL-like lipase/acylhydrolase family protein